MSTYNTKAGKCPHCGHKLDMSTNFAGRGPPSPGDFTFCLYCRSVSAFDDELNLRKVTAEEERELAESPKFRKLAEYAARFMDAVDKEKTRSTEPTWDDLLGKQTGKAKPKSEDQKAQE